MKVTSWGEEYEVTVEKTKYGNNGNLAIQLWCDDGPFATLTVNLNKKLKEGYAYVDINNCPWAEEFIEKNHLGEFADDFGFSGFCIYPLYKFF